MNSFEHFYFYFNYFLSFPLYFAHFPSISLYLAPSLFCLSLYKGIKPGSTNQPTIQPILTTTTIFFHMSEVLFLVLVFGYAKTFYIASDMLPCADAVFYTRAYLRIKSGEISLHAHNGKTNGIVSSSSKQYHTVTYR